MEDPLSEHSGEEKIEDVLQQVKKDFADAARKDPSAKNPLGSADQNDQGTELKNLKNVLLEADLQAGSASAPKDAPVLAERNDQATDNRASFNENFLKLEQLIKDFKK